MAVEVHRVGDISVLHLVGKITTPEGDTEMRERFRERLEAGDRRFVFSFENVPFLDSAAIAETVACGKRSAEVGGLVKIVLAATGRPREAFRITKLDRVFEIYDSEEDAIASFDA